MEHRGDLVLETQECATQVDGHGAVEVPDGYVGERRGRMAAAGGVVDRDVQAPERVERARDHAFDGVRITDVGRDAQRGAAGSLDLGGELLQAGSVAAG